MPQSELAEEGCNPSSYDCYPVQLVLTETPCVFIATLSWEPASLPAQAALQGAG